jgi:hypothetical protein
MQSSQAQPRHLFWRRQYDERRYARHLSQPELNARIRDIFLNLLRVTHGGKIGFFPIDAAVAGWLEKFTHMLEEMQLRYGPYPSGFTREIFHSEPFPAFASDLADKAGKAMSSNGLSGGDALIKFGKRRYMEALYETGALRIQPASYFLEKDHNGAVRDDELSLSFSVALSRDDILKLVVNKQDVPDDAHDQRVDVRLGWPNDYWLYCVTKSIEARLFVDFDADACVIIRDRAAFKKMLRLASEHRLGGATMKEGDAIYLDPVLPTSVDIFLPLVKHFRYSYQNEIRFYWLPPNPIRKVAHIDICIGNLREIAELVIL